MSFDSLYADFPTQSDSSEWGFIQKVNRGMKSYYQIEGTVTDVQRLDRPYSRLHRVLRSCIYSEPYQISKIGRSNHGPNAFYTVVRVSFQMSEKPSSVHVVFCGETGFVSLGDHVRLIARRSTDGVFVYEKGYNISTTTPIRKDILTVSPTLIRTGCLAFVVLVCILVVWLVAGGFAQMVLLIKSFIQKNLHILIKALLPVIIVATILVVLKNARR